MGNTERFLPEPIGDRARGGLLESSGQPVERREDQVLYFCVAERGENGELILLADWVRLLESRFSPVRSEPIENNE